MQRPSQQSNHVIPGTYHVVLTFGSDEDGNLVPLEPREPPNADGSKRRAQAVAAKHSGAVAFSRTGDLNSGEFSD